MASDRITRDNAIVALALLMAHLALGPVLWVVGAMIALAMMIAERGKLSRISSLPDGPAVQRPIDLSYA
jgi:hypothetical protein